MTYAYNRCIKETSMRTTLAINEKLLDEAKELSGARTKKEAVEIELSGRDASHISHPEISEVQICLAGMFLGL
jgi:hypothetical protein